MTSQAPPRIRVMLGALMLVVLLASLDGTIVATALPTIVGDLGGLTHISWVISAYLLGMTATGPLYGKLGDLYGRRIILQAAIAIFLVGSALCGLAQNMPELIAFRALQGVGGGGLIVTSTAVVGDLVAPRDRGRYDSLFTAVIALATVAGPIAGGFFVDGLSWRWIFYVNLPVGVVAFVVIGAAFHGGVRRVRHSIDYAGAALLATALSSVVLVTSLGGSTFAWASAPIAAAIAIGCAAIALLVRVERRAAEPILPPGLLRNRTFTVSATVGLVIGLSVFGSAVYLPLYLQVVDGRSPTSSGLLLTPMMAGALLTSVGAGQLMSATGRYRPFPIIGTAVIAIGVTLLALRGAHSPVLYTSLSALVVGTGLGMVMQVLTVAVQNSVEHRRLGVATSATVLARQVGSCLGASLFGAIFVTHLHAGSAGVSPAAVRRLPPALRERYVEAFAAALHPVYIVAAGVALVGFALTLLLRELPLRTSTASDGEGRAAGERKPELVLEPE